MSLLLRCLLALSMILCTAAAAQPRPAAETIAIVGADVLPMVGPERLRDQTVLVRGDRIVAVGPRARVAIPAGARRIEARGMTLMPGLVDMHVHLAPVPGLAGDAAQRAMAVMLAHGVTTARGMAGSPNNLAVRDAVERGTVAGPRFYAAAPGLNLNNTPSAEAARQAVAAARAAGYDLIKSHHIVDPAVWQAVQEEARRQGLATAGHVTNPIGLERAMAARQQVEHLDGVIFALLPEGAPERQIDFAQLPPPPVIAAASGVGDQRLQALAARVRAAGSYHVPTLALFERIADVGTPTERLMQLPEMRYIPDPVLGQWAQQRAQFGQAGLTAENGQVFRDLRRRIVRAFHAAGVPLMAGSDTPQAFSIWGPGLHAEIGALHAAGLSRMDALRAATVVPRDYFRSLPNRGSSLGWRADFGTVEQGARADLILLRGDPSRDLAVLGRPELVIAGGRAYDRAALDAILEAASRAAKAQQPQPPAPAPGPAARANAPDVYVMRHLQAASGDNPGLSPQGAAQARQLVDFFGASRPTAIYATPFRRSQETAAPLAAALGLQVRTYDPANPQALMQAVASERGPVLIVGHSNTVPDIVAMLGGQRTSPIAHDQFGDMWVVHSGGRTEHRRLP